MLIQIHTLQNYVPSNLNRDDSGSPKDATFGGFLRGRISSQCLKRSIRRGETSPFRAEFEKDGLLGERTRLLPLIVRQELEAMNVDESVVNAIVKRVPEIGRESNKKSQGSEDPGDEGAAESDGDSDSQAVVEDSHDVDATKQLIFVDRKAEVRALAEHLREAYENNTNAWTAKDTKGNYKLKISDITKGLGASQPRSVDIAMFGRMTTSAAFKNVHASVQVAHALSTNTIKQEFDYYTAMDDLKPDSEPGADMIGDVEFNSSCYYKYCNVHWQTLFDNVGKDFEIARRAVIALLKGFIFAQPTGKQNSFAAHNLPDFVLVEVSNNNLPVNYANAFLKPVKGFGEKTLTSNSVLALSDYVGKLSKVFSLSPDRAYLSVDDLPFLELKGLTGLDALSEWLESKLPVGKPVAND
jgi:CRISPR system Cascade subunit CasC